MLYHRQPQSQMLFLVQAAVYLDPIAKSSTCRLQALSVPCLHHSQIASANLLHKDPPPFLSKKKAWGLGTIELVWSISPRVCGFFSVVPSAPDNSTHLDHSAPLPLTSLNETHYKASLCVPALGRIQGRLEKCPGAG